MSFPDFNDLSSFTPTQRQQLEQFVSYVLGYLSGQHKDDGSHSAVTADSLVTGTLSVGAPAALGQGNVTGDLIPTTDDAQSLGVQQAAAPYTRKYWQRLYLGSALHMGKGSAAGVLVPAWTATLGNVNQTWQANAVTGQSISFNNVNSALLMRIGGGVTVGGTFVVDSGVNIPLLQAGDAAFTNGLFERGRNVRLGIWTTFAGTYAAATGTWTLGTGTETTLQYMLVGKSLFLQIRLDGMSNSNATATLSLTLPASLVSNKKVDGVLFTEYTGSGGAEIIRAEAAAGGTTLVLARLGGGNFPANTNTLYIYGCLLLEVQ
jgi:hypothetical protein